MRVHLRDVVLWPNFVALGRILFVKGAIQVLWYWFCGIDGASVLFKHSCFMVSLYYQADSQIIGIIIIILIFMFVY